MFSPECGPLVLNSATSPAAGGYFNPLRSPGAAPDRPRSYARSLPLSPPFPCHIQVTRDDDANTALARGGRDDDGMRWIARARWQQGDWGIGV